jgi:hypothetical protein
MTSFLLALFAIAVGLFLVIGIWARWRRQTGGGWGPTQFSDGSMTINPTGYPEEMKGHAHKIGPTDNNAADYK